MINLLILISCKPCNSTLTLGCVECSPPNPTKTCASWSQYAAIDFEAATAIAHRQREITPLNMSNSSYQLLIFFSTLTISKKVSCFEILEFQFKITLVTLKLSQMNAETIESSLLHLKPKLVVATRVKLRIQNAIISR